MSASFRCIGGVDVDPAAISDFERLAEARGTVLDMFAREDYVAFHGHEPGPDWREATPDDIRAAAGGESPNIVFTSAPCKGFSGLLSAEKSASDKYQALNRLTLRGIWLMLESFADDLPEFVIFENVPRIATRGRHLLDQIVALLGHYGFATAETTHDCGELGGLAQSRKRFLLVARNRAKVPPFLYEPPRRPLRSVGEVLGAFPMPDDPAAGPMHRMRSLQFKTWVRLAFVEAGKDWRSLERLRVVDGKLADYLLAPEVDYHRGYLGVNEWAAPAGTVCGESRPSNGSFSVADPRLRSEFEYPVYGVVRWNEVGKTVTGKAAPGTGSHSIADPRYAEGPNGAHYNNVFRVVRWDGAAGALTAGSGPTAGGQAVADPRAIGGWQGTGKYGVTPWDSHSNLIIAGSTTGQGAFAVQDPRWKNGESATHTRNTLYGVVPWVAPSGAVTGGAKHDTGAFCVADRRVAVLPLPDAKVSCLIIAEDGTWHRPFTTLELAALQSLVDADEHLELHGASDSGWRERIGNAVPAQAAEAIASVMGHAILLARAGHTFELSATPVWVRPFSIAAAVEVPA